ncbi:hypothetical protein D3C75_738700 [compost metagenome]
MRGHEQALVEAACRPQHGTYFTTDTWRCKPVGCKFYKILPAEDVAASLGNSATGVFDQRTRYKISPNLWRLKLFCKFTITIIHKNNDVWFQ